MRASSWMVLFVTGWIGLCIANPAIAQSDPITASRFSLTIDGYEIASFSELQALTSNIEPSEYWETNGDEVRVVKTNKLAGRTKPPTITLRRGMTGSLELWAWHDTVRTGSMNAARKSCSLTMFNDEGQPVAKYWLSQAWPSKIDLAGLKAGSSEALMETVTFTAEHIQRVMP